MEKMFYTMSEVASELGESVSCIRFWCDSFSRDVNPKRNAKGNRLFKPEELETLRLIQYLLKVEGLTIEGAKKKMAEERSRIEKNVKVLRTLKDIKSRLLEIKRFMGK